MFGLYFVRCFYFLGILWGKLMLFICWWLIYSLVFVWLMSSFVLLSSLMNSLDWILISISVKMIFIKVVVRCVCWLRIILSVRWINMWNYRLFVGEKNCDFVDWMVLEIERFWRICVMEWYLWKILRIYLRWVDVEWLFLMLGLLNYG